MSWTKSIKIHTHGEQPLENQTYYDDPGQISFSCSVRLDLLYTVHKLLDFVYSRV